MQKSVIESYPELWHYTTANGLQGILASQQLWATDIRYLNDAEEFVGFFDRKLLGILQIGVKNGLAEAAKTGQGKRNIDAAGGRTKVAAELPSQLLEILRDTTLKLQVYVTSFCAPSRQDGDDGLLSQWRGYGQDGGYAIVFDTVGLNDLLVDEQRRFFYTFGHWGDVDYFGADGSEGAHAEVGAWEDAIRDAIASMIVEQNLHATERLFEPILSLATRHKHRGFREESEVRISVVTSLSGMPPDEARAAGDNRPMKQVNFTSRGGLLVPHIALFERPAGGRAKLPIKKIIVGPHAEKLQRRQTVEKLLDQLDIAASVVTSDIPYVGR